LHKEAQPLIRYRTGDLTIKITTPSVFGRTVCLPGVVFGRTDEMVKVKGVKLYPSEISTVLLGIDGLERKYTLTLSKKPTGGDSINLKIKGEPSDDAVEKITRRFKSQTLVSLDEVQIVTEIGEVPLLVDLRVN